MARRGRSSAKRWTTSASGWARPYCPVPSVVVLSDRHANAELVPIPALLLVSAVHHYLVDKKLRTRVGLVVETGEARTVHHMACLIGYGAAAINPYLAFDTVADQVRHGAITGMSARKALHNYVKAAAKGVLKTMSKMGISTLASYTGAQVFEAVGLSSEVVGRYFKGTVSQLEGIGLEGIAAEALAPPPRRLAGAGERPGAPRPRAGRRLAMAARGRVPPFQPRDGVQAAASDAFQALQHLQASTPTPSTTSRATSRRCGGSSGCARPRRTAVNLSRSAKSSPFRK